ncbi:aminotransferase class V-fold PLP-dependent enzyme [Mediterraneibacter glycyrrhizinilyticus]|uniref:cysteine desulfurase family protein n=1 Tax=Mediterraneibacter glycyrrhizinilyticus TaxID=342942 RepID=UPI00265960DB|nr:aminotransferase class V-fold PLP-dependent enzyme [Mediterraneibacter glycyrrhizinilyticus]MCF2569358.1 aminotransferase class V-fold PLP-dependent enzyme [Mediterraneibacter glycyrrhizinilyticus]
MSVYLDFNSSAPIDERVLEYMIGVYRNSYGNADSRTHDFGDSARRIVEDARGRVSSILGAGKDEVFFTSGATESNNIVLQGLKSYALESGKKHIITSAIEHKSVLETAKVMQLDGFEVDFVKPGLNGQVSAEEIISLVRDDTLLVSIMHVNNETGVIQPVKEIGQSLADLNTFFHIDATQSFGKLVDELRDTKYDMLSMSAHKIGGPQGVGALVLRKKQYKRPPVKGIMFGGQQEHGIRPGTIPVPLVAGLGKACQIAEEEYHDNQEKCEKIKCRILDILDESGIDYEINGDQTCSVPGTLNVCFNGVSSEALMLASRQYCGVSNGSACNSSSYSPSFVLTAMGIPIEKIENSIRISWGSSSDPNEVADAFENLVQVAKKLAF